VEIFFYFFYFIIIILEMNPVKYFFPNLILFSRSNPSDVAYEGVTPVHLTRLKGLARARSPRWPGWCHIVSVTPIRSA
jgi:hypothetical protein